MLKNININNVKEFIVRRKYILLIILVLIISLVVVFSIINKDNDMPSINYNGINELIDKDETFIVYYYNSKSRNKYNKKVKKELDNNDINYYLYDDKNVSKDEYNNFTTLIGIDSKLLGTPAIIYIKDGDMYSNLININNMDSLDKYIEDYDLVTVK